MCIEPNYQGYYHKRNCNILQWQKLYNFPEVQLSPL